ncbi:MAG: ArgE/DapE family deacylase [Gemmatimonadetes bacterium]|nr:ArgE/DapE family deacylase [Gemmatimonadota bacterium]NIR81565.1 ArgE/DapE family deacylase [Gemmatimonadota bacterium]NIT90406.1 ArgE/DapE family deacylase [Gemmatimonadota bacterium]NIU34240.1 ArgE/DapE family deacylase [Gemmatimonadota bacterium]NIU38368.1 ArgE/DapE family deacylase [Gemmatimonadota bacterium]
MTARVPEEVAVGARAGDPVALTRAMVAVPSVNPEIEAGGAGEEELARLCAAWLDGWGFQVDLVEVAAGRWNVVGRHGGGRPALLLNGHLDTVGVEGMTIPPFQAEHRDGRVWGRGACDMKGGDAALLAAAARLADRGHGGQLIVALTADEEHASVGMEALVASGVEADAGIVCEPTELAVMPAHKGFLWAELHVRGRAAHGSRPDLGVDAIRHTARYLCALDDYEARLEARDPHQLLTAGSIHAGKIRGGSAPSVYPEECALVLERRTLPGEDRDAVISELLELLDRLRAEVPELEAELVPGLGRPGTEVPTDSALVEGLLAAVAEERLEARVEGMSAWVDAALLNEAGIPALCFGPGSISLAHAAEEWVPDEEIQACARVLERFGRGFLDRT